MRCGGISHTRPTSSRLRAAIRRREATASRSFSWRIPQPKIAEQCAGGARRRSEGAFHGRPDQIVACKIEPAAVTPRLRLERLKASDRAKAPHVETRVRVVPARELREERGLGKRWDDALPVHEELLLDHLCGCRE